jgi:hypothetical protein
MLGFKVFRGFEFCWNPLLKPNWAINVFSKIRLEPEQECCLILNKFKFSFKVHSYLGVRDTRVESPNAMLAI